MPPANWATGAWCVFSPKPEPLVGPTGREALLCKGSAGLIDNSVFLASSVLAFWGLGRAVRKHQPGAWLFLWLILCYPAIYYFVYPHARYRHPIEPELGMLILYVISEARRKPALS